MSDSNMDVSFESLNGVGRVTRIQLERHLESFLPLLSSSRMAVARKSLFIYVLSMINWSRNRVYKRYPMSEFNGNENEMV